MQDKNKKGLEKALEEWYGSFDDANTEDVFASQEEKRTIRSRIQGQLQGHIRQNRNKARRIAKLRYAMSAAVILLLMGGVLWQVTPRLSEHSPDVMAGKQQLDTVRTGIGQIKQIQMPDGTTIWLNANAQLCYDQTNFNRTRVVSLSYGEAFFDVYRDPSRPFTVEHGHMQTEVLGTSFSIQNYSDLSYGRVQVKTGKVRVSSTTGRGNSTALQKGQGIRYQKDTHEFQEDSRFAADSDSWINGDVYLHDATFEELGQILYNRYGIQLRSDLAIVQHHRYTIRFQGSQAVDEILELISTIHGHQYRRRENHVTIY